MKKLFLVAMALFLALGLGAQNKKQIYNPQGGDFSIGVTFNPLAIKNHDYQPDANAWAGDFVKGVGGNPKQMFILSTDPLVSFMLNYHFSPVVSLRANFGITGSQVNYKEYVTDDMAVHDNIKSEAKTVDVASSKLNGTTIGVGLEFTKAFGRLAFVGGFGLQYAIGGGSMAFSYGNSMNSTTTGNGTKLPSTMTMLKLNGENTLNEYSTVSNSAMTAHPDYTIVGRPVERRNVGMNHGIGLTADMGIEYFFAGRMSIGASVTFTPIMFVFQPQTYTKYEVYNKSTKQGEVWDKAVVSPGSTAFLYGTQNLGLRFAFKYYL